MFMIHRSAKGRVVIGAVAALALIGVVGCSSSSSSSSSGASGSGSSKKVTIGFSPYNQTAPALIGLAKGVKAYAQSKGASALIADPNNDATKQAQQIRTWMELGQVQAVWVLAINPTAIKPLIQLAKQKKIGLLTTGVPSDYGASAPDAGISYSIIDYTAFGKAMGAALAECANQRLAGKAQVLYVQNPAGSTGKAAQDASLEQTLTANSPNSKIVATIDSQNDRLKSQQGTLSAIQGNSSIDAAVGGTDEATLGALTAFPQAGKDLSKSCVVGAGGSDEALAAVKSGKLYAEVAIQFSADMQQSVDELIAMANNPSATGRQLYTPFKTVKK